MTALYVIDALLSSPVVIMEDWDMEKATKEDKKSLKREILGRCKIISEKVEKTSWIIRCTVDCNTPGPILTYDAPGPVHCELQDGTEQA